MIARDDQDCIVVGHLRILVCGVGGPWRVEWLHTRRFFPRITIQILFNCQGRYLRLYCNSNMWVWMSLFTLPINHLRNIPGIQSIQLWCKCSRYHRNNNLTPCKTSSFHRLLMFIPWRGETTQLASIQLTPTHIRCLTVIHLMRPQNTLRFLIILIDILICCSHFSWRAVDGQV